MTTQLTKNRNRNCSICKKPGELRVIETLPHNAKLWRMVHDDGTKCEWEQYDSVDSYLQPSVAEEEIEITCPICATPGIIITYRKEKNRIHYPWIYEYKIKHKTKQCLITEQVDRDDVLQHLGRYIPENEARQLELQEDERVRKRVSSQRNPIRIECPFCHEVGRINHFRARDGISWDYYIEREARTAGGNHERCMARGPERRLVVERILKEKGLQFGD